MNHATHAILGLLLASCAKGGATPAGGPDAGIGEAAVPDVGVAIALAENQRRARDVPAASLHEHDPAVRRLAARALARIQDADDAPLLRALEDADDAVVAWAAYGLGESCKAHEETHAGALAARLASLDPARGASIPVDTRIAILRALGHCGGEVAEQTLRAWLRRTDAAPFTSEVAALALGDVASRRGSVSLESSVALLDAVQRNPPVDAALYAFGRTESVGGEDLAPRLLAASLAALARPGADRFFAVRALGRAGADGAGDLGRVLASSEFTPPERAEAARSLGRLHRPGQNALLGALGAIMPERGDQLTGDLPGVLRSALGAVSDERPAHTDAPLWAATRLEAPPGAAPALVRRISQIRCAAAEKLALGAWDSDVLRGCDVGDGEAGEAARLAALDRGELTKSRRAAWLELTRSTHVRVREGSIEVITRHPELGSVALGVLADALSSAQAGVVATAADVVHAHPDRLYVLAASERRAALDPRAPPPTSHPLQELDAGIARAMRAALAHTWAPDLVETRVALVDASLAISLDEGRAYAEKACHDANVTVRARAAKALAAAGEKDATCPPSDAPAAPAQELGHELAHPTRVVLDVDGATLGIRFDSSLAPVAATRFVALARSGFYTGVVVHRVVPGFVVQFGDRGADGYGGSGEPLRCETSPVPFGPLDVGVALAGRDTGSSQIFVTLSVQPHLDGEYAWVGHADGDWNGVAEGDVIRAVRVEE